MCWFGLWLNGFCPSLPFALHLGSAPSPFHPQRVGLGFGPFRFFTLLPQFFLGFGCAGTFCSSSPLGQPDLPCWFLVVSHATRAFWLRFLTSQAHVYRSFWPCGPIPFDLVQFLSLLRAILLCPLVITKCLFCSRFSHAWAHSASHCPSCTVRGPTCAPDLHLILLPLGLTSPLCSILFLCPLLPPPSDPAAPRVHCSCLSCGPSCACALYAPHLDMHSATLPCHLSPLLCATAFFCSHFRLLHRRPFLVLFAARRPSLHDRRDGGHCPAR